MPAYFVGPEVAGRAGTDSRYRGHVRRVREGLLGRGRERREGVRRGKRVVALEQVVDRAFQKFGYRA